MNGELPLNPTAEGAGAPATATEVSLPVLRSLQVMDVVAYVAEWTKMSSGTTVGELQRHMTYWKSKRVSEALQNANFNSGEQIVSIVQFLTQTQPSSSSSSSSASPPQDGTDRTFTDDEDEDGVLERLLRPEECELKNSNSNSAAAAAKAEAEKKALAEKNREDRKRKRKLIEDDDEEDEEDDRKEVKGEAANISGGGCEPATERIPLVTLAMAPLQSSNGTTRRAPIIVPPTLGGFLTRAPTPPPPPPPPPQRNVNDREQEGGITISALSSSAAPWNSRTHRSPTSTSGSLLLYRAMESIVSSRVGTETGIKRSTASNSNSSTNSSSSHSAASKRGKTAHISASEVASLVHLTSFRATVLLLCFHRVKVIHTWARDTAIQLLTSCGDSVAEVWRYSLLVLLTLKRLTTLADVVNRPLLRGCCDAGSGEEEQKGGGGVGRALDAAEVQERQSAWSHGIASLLLILSQIDRRLSKDQQPQAQGSAATLQQTLADSGIASATVLLLGGSYVLQLMLPNYAHAFRVKQLLVVGTETSSGDTPREAVAADYASRDAASRERTASSCRILLTLLNERLTVGVQSCHLAAMLVCRKSLIKVIIHVLLDISKTPVYGGSDEEAASGVIVQLLLAAMRDIWRLAAHIDPPPESGASRVASPPPSAKAAGWLIRFALKNAAAQLGMERIMPALLAALQKRSATNPRNANATNLSTDNTVEEAHLATDIHCAAAAYARILSSLVKALPNLAFSPFMHDIVQENHKEWSRLVAGDVLLADHTDGIALLTQMLTCNIVGFHRSSTTASSSSSSPTTLAAASLASSSSSLGYSSGKAIAFDAFRSAWELLPFIVQRLAAQPEVRHVHLVLSVIEVLDVFLRTDSAGSWLFLNHFSGATAVSSSSSLSSSSSSMDSTSSAPLLLQETAGPLGYAVEKCLRALSNALLANAAELKASLIALVRVVETPALIASGASVLSTPSAMPFLMKSHNALLRLSHALRLAVDPSVVALGESIRAVFLSTLTPMVHKFYRSDAAAAVLRHAVLSNPLLLTNSSGGSAGDGPPLRYRYVLQDPKVDTLARKHGNTWISLLSAINMEQLNGRGSNDNRSFNDIDDNNQEESGSFETSGEGREAGNSRNEGIAMMAVEMRTALWWLTVLIMDVVLLTPEVRTKFLMNVVAQLPNDVVTAPREEAARLEERRRQLRSSEFLKQRDRGADSYDSDDGAEGSSAVGSNERREMERQLKLTQHSVALVKHAMVCITAKSSLYAPEQLVACLVRLSGVLPVIDVAKDKTFRANLKKSLAVVWKQLTDVQRGELEAYAAPWLKEIVHAAQQQVSDFIEDQNRRFQQFEFEEKRLQMLQAEENRQREAEAAMQRQNAELRRKEMEAERRKCEAAKQSAAMRDLFANASTVKPASSASSAAAVVDVDEITGEEATTSGAERNGQTGLPSAHRNPFLSDGVGVDGEDDSGSVQENVPDVEVVGGGAFPSQSRLSGLARENRIVESLKRFKPKVFTPSAAPTTTQQLQSHHNVMRINHMVSATSKEAMQEQLRRVAFTTDLTAHPSPRIDDIIGDTTACIAMEVPLIPLSFHSDSQSGTGSRLLDVTQYPQYFLPHVALSLRYELHQRFDEFMDSVLRSVSQQTQQKTHVKRPRDQQASVNELRNALAACGCMQSTLSYAPSYADRLDPSKMIFTVTASPVKGASATAFNPLLSMFEGDVTLVVVPMAFIAHLLPSTAQQSNRRNHVFHRMVDAGLYAFPAVLTSVHLATSRATVTAYARDGDLIPISQVLATARDFAGRVPVFLRRMSSMGQFLNAVSATHDVVLGRFGPLLIDPHREAVASKAYHAAIVARYGPSQTTTTSTANEDVQDVSWKRRLLLRSLNEWQQLAVASVLKAVVPSWDATATRLAGLPTAPSLHIIEGPPGTGKTHTITSVVANLLHNLPMSRRRIVICAPSNTAVDEVLLRLSTTLPRTGLTFTPVLLRVGVRENVSPEVLAAVPPLFLEDNVDISLSQLPQQQSRMGPNALGSLSKGKNMDMSYGERQRMRATIAESANVVCTTLGSLAQLARLGVSMSVVIVDEASQATEPDVVQALAMGCNECILVGDPQQLQPTVLCDASAAKGFKRSLLQRLLDNGYASVMLRTQYRMHPDICAFPNAYFYRNQLRTAQEVLLRTAAATGGGLRSHFSLAMRQMPRLVFVDVPNGSMTMSRGKSLENGAEALALINQLMLLRRTLLQHSNAPSGMPASMAGTTTTDPTAFVDSKIGIITFYRAQKTLLSNMLRQRTSKATSSGGGDGALAVSTVDGFQGKEKDIIFISCVRAPWRNQRGGALSAAPRGTEAENTGEDGDLNDAVSWEERGTSGRNMSGRSAGLGFVADWHRLNVALTRAKELCVVFGHRQTIMDAAQAAMASSSSSTSSDSVVTLVNPRNPVNARGDDDQTALGEFIKYVAAHQSDPHARQQQTGSSSSATTSEAVQQDDCRALLETDHTQLNLFPFSP